MPITMSDKPNLDKEPDYITFLNALIQKTKEGKLNWQETAREGQFIAAVRGQQLFEICKTFTWDKDEQAETSDFVVTAKDSDGRVLFRTPSRSLIEASELYELAERVAKRVDEQLQSTVEFLNSL